MDLDLGGYFYVLDGDLLGICRIPVNLDSAKCLIEQITMFENDTVVDDDWEKRLIKEGMIILED